MHIKHQKQQFHIVKSLHIISYKIELADWYKWWRWWWVNMCEDGSHRTANKILFYISWRWNKSWFIVRLCSFKRRHTISILLNEKLDSIAPNSIQSSILRLLMLACVSKQGRFCCIHDITELVCWLWLFFVFAPLSSSIQRMNTSTFSESMEKRGRTLICSECVKWGSVRHRELKMSWKPKTECSALRFITPVQST